MEDRFKFRAWDRVDNQMCDVHGWFDDMNGRKVDYYGHVTCDNVDAYEVDPVTRERRLTLMQCTSLKDKNGKLIYEGDMCLLSGLSYQVVWFDYCWAFIDCPDYHYGDGFEKFRRHIPFDETGEPGADYYKNCEIIGNIHENPELLEAHDK